MKFKQLTIHNIATIADATINFDQPPLDNERIFLICGPTGAGKTTILDCICLALFKNTPRLDEDEGNRFNPYTDRERADKDIGTNDSRQLMRRGCGDAKVELTFEDNQGVDHQATWECHRARNRADGSFQPVQWYYTNLHTNEVIRKGVDEYAQRLLGINAAQFFRTVVLPQGKFAEFLKSKENDKTLLLEKITGTHIYATLGMRIFNQHKALNEQCERLMSEMAAMHVLTPQQEQEINDQLQALQARAALCDQQAQQVDKKFKWLEQREKKQQDLGKARLGLESQIAITQQEDYRQEQQLAEQWAASDVARQHWNTIDKQTRQLEHSKQTGVQLQERYDDLCAALRLAQRQLGDLKLQLDELNQKIAAEEPHSAMLQQMAMIEDWTTRITNNNALIDKNKGEVEKEQQRLPQAQQQLAEARQREEDAAGALERVNSQLDALDVNGLNQQRRLVDAAIASVNTLLQKQQDADKEQQELTAALDALKKQEDELPGLKSELERYEKEKDLANEAYTNQLQWDKLLDEARNHLHQGDACPICRNTITRLPDKHDTDLLLQQARARKEKADADAFNASVKEKAAQKNLKQLKTSAKNQQETLDKAVKARDSQQQQAVKDCNACGAELTADNTTLVLNGLKSQQESLNQQIDKAEALRKESKKCQTDLDKARKLHLAAQKAVETIDQCIDALKRDIQRMTGENHDVMGKLDNAMTIADWQQQWASDPQFVANLKRRAAAWNDNKQRAQRLEGDISKMQQDIEFASASRGDITGMDDHQRTATTPTPQLGTKWHKLETDCKAWQETTSRLQQDINDAQQHLRAFLDDNPAFSQQRIAQLAAIPHGTIQTINDRHSGITQTINQLRGQLRQLQDDLDNLNANQPQHAENDPAVLQQEQQRLATEKTDVQQQIGALTQQLLDNKQSLESRAEQQRQLDALTAQRDQWGGLKDLLGDARGNKFRLVAQSYILGDLLHNANRYLAAFDPRLRLTCQRGSLAILVYNTESGSAPLSAATLSGGQCFMASLALALALAQMGGRVMPVNTLFIDEGFGTLSNDYLNNVVETLGKLRQIRQCNVGIISHVEELRERITTQIQVLPDPNDNTASLLHLHTQ